jgi:shikimate 5-dehydrogenase
LGLVGHGIGHSLSPALHHAMLARCGLQGSYQLFDGLPLATVLARLRSGELDGLNITTPLKSDASQACSWWYNDGELLPRRPPLPVNTVWRYGGGWAGASTDGRGMLATLEAAGLAVAGARIWLLGAGGAATSVAASLAHAGAAVHVSARRMEAAMALQAAVPSVSTVPWGAAPPAVDAVLHLTRWGHGEQVRDDSASAAAAAAWSWLPWRDWRLRPPLLVDAVYARPDGDAAAGATWWEHAAQSAAIPPWQGGPQGLLSGGGRWMLAAQAAASFELWTGCQVPWRDVAATVLAARPTTSTCP